MLRLRDRLRPGRQSKDDGAADDVGEAVSVVDAGNELKPDLCIIGAGSGGLSVAAAAAQLGVDVVLIEKHKMGGDCLNYGCVPSKALIASAKRAHVMRTSKAFGIIPTSPSISHKAVQEHVQGVIDAIAPNDSVERFTGLGVKVIQAPARFVDRTTIAAGDYLIKARRTVIATGSSPAVPPIPGLDKIAFFTNETIFANTEKLEHLIIIGGGPIGMELAQAYLRLGSRVTVVEMLKAIGKDDPELADVVLKKVRLEGVVIHEGTRVEGVEPIIGGGVRVSAVNNGQPIEIDGTHLLVATGRMPNMADLHLDVAGIEYDRPGIKVDAGLRTTNRKVFAIGDVTGGLQFTHVANYHAGIVLRRALFRLPAKVNTDSVPWVTFTDPELAHVGLSEDEAKKRHSKVNVYRWPYHENDRAQAEHATEGFVKVVTATNGKILGASIVGQNAGEIIQMWSLALSQGMKIAKMTNWISPYPTLTEINKRAAYGYYAASVSNPFLRKAVDLLAKLG